MRKGPQGKEGTGWGPQAISPTALIFPREKRWLPSPTVKEMRFPLELTGLEPRESLAWRWRLAECVWLAGEAERVLALDLGKLIKASLAADFDLQPQV